MAQIEQSSGGKGKKSRQKKMTIHVDFTPMVDMNMLLITFFMLCTTMIKSQTLQISLPSNEKVDKTEQNKVKQSEAITIILDSERHADVKDELTGKMLKGQVKKNLVYYYEGQPNIVDENKDGLIDANNMNETEFLPNSGGVPQGIREIIHDRNKQVIEKINVLKEQWRDKKLSDEEYQKRAKEIRNDSTLTRPIVIIKATPNASYENLIGALDEMQINSISRYQIDRMNATDSALMMDIKAKNLRK
ncbi:MAG: biopolymer transporter ExbD [Muribaculaceae bacterium]|nr:biopolymer transporter ExbD [Muribaculaceae bacterium]